MTDIGWTTMGMNKVHEEGYLECDVVHDGQPAQLS